LNLLSLLELVGRWHFWPLSDDLSNYQAIFKSRNQRLAYLATSVEGFLLIDSC